KSAPSTATDWTAYGKGKGEGHTIADATRLYVKLAGASVVEVDGQRKVLQGITVGEVLKGLKGVGITTSYGSISNALGLTPANGKADTLLTGAEAQMRVFAVCKE